MGTCGEAVHKITWARTLCSQLSTSLLSAFTGLVEQYNSEQPQHQLSLWTWMLGYKSSMIRKDEIFAQNFSISQLFGTTSAPMVQSYGFEWPTVAVRLLCSEQETNDLSEIVNAWIVEGEREREMLCVMCCVCC